MSDLCELFLDCDLCVGQRVVRWPIVKVEDERKREERWKSKGARRICVRERTEPAKNRKGKGPEPHSLPLLLQTVVLWSFVSQPWSSASSHHPFEGLPVTILRPFPSPYSLPLPSLGLVR
jgi:hypothetical protein